MVWNSMQKYVPLVNKIEVFILGGQRIDQKRKKGWWRGEKEGMVEREKREDWERQQREDR